MECARQGRPFLSIGALTPYVPIPGAVAGDPLIRTVQILCSEKSSLGIFIYFFRNFFVDFTCCYWTVTV